MVQCGGLQAVDSRCNGGAPHPTTTHATEKTTDFEDFLDKLEGDDLKTMGIGTEEHRSNQNPYRYTVNFLIQPVLPPQWVDVKQRYSHILCIAGISLLKPSEIVENGWMPCYRSNRIEKRGFMEPL